MEQLGSRYGQDSDGRFGWIWVVTLETGTGSGLSKTLSKTLGKTLGKTLIKVCTLLCAVPKRYSFSSKSYSLFSFTVYSVRPDC